MGWNGKIKLAVNLLSEIISEFPESEELVHALECLNEYLGATDFKTMSDEDKRLNSICILSDAVAICLPKIVELQEQASPSPPLREMTMAQATELLRKEYLEALEKGDDEVLGMNVNEWIESHGIVIVPESSSPKDGEDGKSDS